MVSFLCFCPNRQISKLLNNRNVVRNLIKPQPSKARLTHWGRFWAYDVLTNSFSIIGVSFECKKEVWVGFLLFFKPIHLSIDMKARVQELNAIRNNPPSQEESNADQARRDHFRKRIHKAVAECRLRHGTYVVLKELHAKGTAAECQV